MKVPAIGILYWNVRKNERCLLVLKALVAARSPGVVMLTECPFDDTAVLACLGAAYRAPEIGQHRYVKFYTSRPDSAIENNTYKRFVMARLGNGPASLLLVGLHLPSKLYGQSQNKQARKAEDYRLLIEEQEQTLNLYKTVQFGDFNMNPYEWGMLDRSRGFRTVPTRRLALQSVPLVAPPAKEGEEVALPRRCFYNPMWAWLGDYYARTADPKPAGTYFWSPGNPEDTHWNSLDGVIVSPEAIGQFAVETLEIITQTTALDKFGKPEHVLFDDALVGNYSDHLPLYFCFHLS